MFNITSLCASGLIAYPMQPQNVQGIQSISLTSRMHMCQHASHSIPGHWKDHQFEPL